MKDPMQAAGRGSTKWGRRLGRARLAPVFLVLLLAACATQEAERAPPGPRAFISPAGEPFRSGPGAPIDRWRAQADADGDGGLQRPELVKDFGRFFVLLDVDKNGYIEGREITRYEQQIAPEILGGGPGPAKLINDAEPVMSADYDLNHRVAKAEFERKAAEAFRLLDVNGDDKLTADELQPVQIARPGPGGRRGGRRPDTGENSGGYMGSDMGSGGF